MRLEKRVAELEAANETNLQRGNLWRDDCARFEREVERVVAERDAALKRVEELEGALGGLLYEEADPEESRQRAVAALLSGSVRPHE